MNWEHLLSTRRYKQTSNTSALLTDRNDFEKDFDRIVFSSSFRKLQDKTQVIPFPINDFVHSRLTHSLEVSCVGRSLGKIVGSTLLERHQALKKSGIESATIGAIVAAASLAHDIGNPPFGHSGEDAFRSFFKYGKGKKYQSLVSTEQWADLIKFEGNANGFRILAGLNQDGGLRLTNTVLASFTKYPIAAINIPKQPHAHQKKNGYFQAEKTEFLRVFKELNIKPDNSGYYRHPLAYLMEAADDVCYSIIDFEDGIRLGLIPIQEAYELFSSLLGEQLQLNKLKKLNSLDEQAGLMRALAINQLTKELAQIFLDSENNILNGSFQSSLLKQSSFIAPLKTIKSLSIEKIYQSEKVLMIEATGFEVIEGLLAIFVEAACAQQPSLRSNKIRQVIPSTYLLDQHDESFSTYNQLLYICDYVSGLSDSQAISLYRKLKGIEIPG